MSSDAVRAALAERNAERGTHFWIQVSEDDAQDIASGYVPNHVKAMVRTMLEWQEEDRRRAERPVKKGKR